jgi:hypothetical protein
MAFLEALADLPRANQQALDLSRPSLLIVLRPLAPDRVLRRRFGNGHQYAAQIPFRLVVRTVHNVIDLRRPAARDWLVQQFNGGTWLGDEWVPTMPYRRPLSDFSELLPSLLDQWLGGGWSTGNLTGIFARRAGASGLVYPSARSNSSVVVEDGEVLNASGWCFVQYEGAPEMRTVGGHTEASDDWPTSAGYSPSNASPVGELIPVPGADIDYVRSGSRAGSWSCSGVAEFTWAGYHLSQVLPVLAAIGGRPGTKLAAQLSNTSLFSASEDVDEIASSIRAALLGDRAARAALEDRRAAVPPEEAKLVTDVLRLVDRAPTRFRTMRR